MIEVKPTVIGSRYSFEHKKTGLTLIGVAKNLEGGLVALDVTDSPFFDPNKHDYIQIVKRTLLSFVDNGPSSDSLELKKLKEELTRKDMVIEGLRNENGELGDRLKISIKNYDSLMKSLEESREKNIAIKNDFDNYKEGALSGISDLEKAIENLLQENKELKKGSQQTKNTTLELELMRRIIAMQEGE